MLNNKSILITGGTGSFGKAFCLYLLRKYKKIKKIIIFSRDEFKQYEMEKEIPSTKYQVLRYFLGDVRDYARVERAFEGVDVVVHAAALKQVEKAENNPMEVIKTNILGAQNIIDACLNTRVSNVIALSTDKASSPLNLYGATKLCSDKLFVSANNIKGSKNIKFSVVRYGNVLGSRGSVLPIFLNQKNKNIFTITDQEMTRFNITLDEGVKFVDWGLNNNFGGEIFVPKISSFRIIDLAKAINPKSKFNIVGIRPGEKIHEEMISESDSLNTVETKKAYIILNNLNKNLFSKIKKYHQARSTKAGFRYISSNSENLLKVDEIRKIINKNFSYIK